MEYFAEQLQARSNGRIVVENYFSGVLGSEREMMDMVATGVLQGTRQSPDHGTGCKDRRTARARWSCPTRGRSTQNPDSNKTIEA